MCWAIAPGDNEGVKRQGNEIYSFSTDINGGHEGCNMSNAETSTAGGSHCIGIRTTGTTTTSHSTIGVVCVK